jgi:hypothetical protein
MRSIAGSSSFEQYCTLFFISESGRIRNFLGHVVGPGSGINQTFFIGKNCRKLYKLSGQFRYDHILL